MASGKIKIVIIDDEKDLCFLLSSMLGMQGFEVSTFYTLESGLAGVHSLVPDWVIIDNDLPDGLGWEKTNSILHLIPGVKIIKISANPDSYESSHDKNVYYLIKPIHVNSVLELVNASPA